MSELHVFTDSWGTDTVVAANIDDAWAIWCETTGERREDYDETATDAVGSMTWERLSDDAPLVITFDEDDGHDFTGDVSKTCREWVREMGRGYLCGMEY